MKLQRLEDEGMSSEDNEQHGAATALESGPVAPEAEQRPERTTLPAPSAPHTTGKGDPGFLFFQRYFVNFWFQ